MSTSNTMTTCNICLDDKEDKDMVRKLPSSDCKCTFRRCIDCALQCDFYLCPNSKCPRVHDSCPQCKLQVAWPACASQHVLSDAKRMGYLFNKARELYQDTDERYDDVKDQLNDWERWYDENIDKQYKIYQERNNLRDDLAELKRLNARLIERLKAC